jgi:diguanylate cyclase (GGDEF)-like protein/PAS domain S-box-containing protein
MIGADVISDIQVLRRKWNAALKPGHRLPPYEDIMLGSLGRLADHVMLLKGEAGTTLTLVRAGQYVHDWLGTNDNDIAVAELPADCAIALNDGVVAAAAACKPSSSTAYRVRDGLIETYDVLAMPLANRWGAPLMAVYVRERGSRFELVDSIYRSTNEGMIALVAIRAPNGADVVDFQILDLNDGAERLLQLPASRLRWRKIGGSSHPFATTETLARLKSALVTQRREQFEISVTADSGTSYVRVGLAATGDLVCATLSDVTEIKRSEASFRLLFESNPTPMWVFDVESLRFLSVNAAAIEHYGYAREKFLAMSYSDLWPAAERASHLEALRGVAEEAYQSSQSWHHAKSSGELIEVVTFGRRISFENRAAFLVTVMDVTERRRAEARIAHMAHHDALTDLPNRTVFSQRLNDALTRVRRERERIAVLWIDLDHFKSINDSFGHSVGDRLLKAAAERLRNASAEGALVARLGGDEFAVLLEKVTTPNDASAAAERLIEALSIPFMFDGTEMTVGTSVGIALFPGDGETADEMLRNADLALYRAKADGRGTHHFFEPEMDREAQKRRSLERDLRKGLTRGEFELYYQPLIDLASERHHRLRIAVALESSGARHGAAGRVHLGGRGDRPDRADRRVGAAGGLQRGRKLAGRRQDRGQLVATAIPQPQPGGRRDQRAGALGPRATAARAGNH